MAAYAAVVSLMQIFDQIKHHPFPLISMDKKQVESLTKIVMFLQGFVEGYKSPVANDDEADPLEMSIADAVYATEDVIESHIFDQIHPTVLASTALYETMINVIKDMNLIKEETRTIFGVVKAQKKISASSSASADLYETLDSMINDMDSIIEEMITAIATKGQLQRQVSASAGFSTFSDLYESMVKGIELIDLIKKQVLEMAAVNEQMQRQLPRSTDSLTCANFYKSRMKLMREHVVLIKNLTKLITEVNGHRQVSASSADLYRDLVKVIEDMDLIKNEVMEIVALKDQRQVLESGGSATSSKMLRNDSSTSSLARLKSTTVVGFDDVMLHLMDKLTDGQLGRIVIPIVGMGGIGKTTLAITVYEKPFISHHFDICAWVTISQQFHTKELLCEILSQANKEEKERLSQMREDEIGLALHKYLSYRRYLIVLDDMWSIEAWDKIQCFLPHCDNGSRIVVTTRLLNLRSLLDNNYVLQMKFMDEENSWNMFSKIVFGRKSCPSELEKIGKKIVESCRGLPLSIVVMGGLLEKMKRTIECWESIRKSINSLVNSDNDKHCLKILKLSYNHLPVHLKPCFLYLGIFENDSEIRVSTIFKLWISEGFLKPISGKSLEVVAKEYLDELVDRNLILVHKFGKTGNMKYCKIHDLFRDLCLREAQRERFYHVVGQHSTQGTCSQRRVVITGNTSQEEVVDAMKSRPYVRTCISERERFQFLPNLRLLRTLRACGEDFYRGHEYSLRKLFELVNLRLLVVNSEGYSDHLPFTINHLWSLQTLTTTHHVDGIYVPVQIWNMPQLRHVHFRGRALHLLDPPSDYVVVMKNLQTLKGVKNFKCDDMMVQRIPNIRKLGLIYSEDDDDYCVHNIRRLHKLESLSFKGYAKGDMLLKLTFPSSLKSLTLEMFKGRMEEMLEKVSALPLLEKLKLKYGDFRTGKWETVEGKFSSLKYLSVAYGYHLKRWTTDSCHFPCLEHLHLSNLQDLKEIPAELGEIPTLKYVAVEHCRKSAVKSAAIMVEEQRELQGEDLSFQVLVTLMEENKELQRLANPNFQVTVLYV